jgi:tetratricopeptide (TPR) repeat protein
MIRTDKTQTKGRDIMHKLKPVIVKIALLLFLFSGSYVQLIADGLPGEYYVTQRWRDLLAGHSPATNPAFMTEENYFTTRMALSPTLQNTFFLMEVGAIVPIGLYQSAGISYLGLSSGDDIQRTYYDEGQDEIIATDEYLNGNQNLFIFSYAANPVGRLSIGTNVNFFHRANFDSTVMQLGLDLALSYRFLRHPLLGDHIFGINIQNLLSPDMGFQSWQNEAANLKISWLGRIWEKRIELGIDLDIKDFMSQTEDFAQASLTGGAPKQIEFDFNSRIGFWLLGMLNIYFQAGSDYWGVSPGLNVPTVNMGRDLQVAYQFMSIIDDIDLTSTHTLYFRGDFGKHREEIYARKMARLASLGPTQLYNKARTLYSQGKYWDAFFIFGKILTEYPDFFKNDWVQLHMGLCQENLEMREYATENYNKTKKAYPRSAVGFHADLGLLRIHYRDKNSFGALNQFTKINNSNAPDSLKYHACYYMGLQHIHDKNFQKAIELFDIIPQHHSEYAFAQFSAAVAYASLNKVSDAASALENVIQATPFTREQQEIQNRAFVLMGYIFFEGLGDVEQSLQRAVAALRKVPINSYYYVDAQLGLAWAALKASQWADCILACDEIIKLGKVDVLLCEAMLLKGYAAVVTNEFEMAVAALSSANELISEATAPSESEKSAATTEYDENRATYYKIASTMDGLGYTGQSSYIIKQVDSLHVPQMEYEKKIRGYHKFVDEFGRRSYFSKPLEKLREDIEYALAKAEKIASEGKEIRIKDSAGEKIEKIDDEMKRLEEELEKLNDE